MTDIQKEVISIYDALHPLAEPAWEERRTSAYIANYLKPLGYEVTEGLAGGTGVVAVLRGSEPGETLGLRADIDALLFTIDGEKRCIHACGHDAHTAMLLTLAREVAARGGIRRGTLKLIFQPAEEVDTGSRAMIKDGVVDDVDWLFAMHLRPVQELSDSQCSPAMFHGSCYMVEAEIIGRGAHAGRPHLAVNSAEIAVQIVNGINAIRENPSVQHSAKVTKIVAAEPSLNTIPRRAEIAIDLRSQTNPIMQSLIGKVCSIIETTAKLFGGEAHIKTPEGVPAAEINEEARALAREAIVHTVGEENVVEEVVSPGADDFHYYINHKPALKATYIGIGCGLEPGLHAPDMHFNREGLVKGVRIYEYIVEKLLGLDRNA